MLAPFRAGRDSYVELDDGGVHVHLGKLFDQTVDYSAIESASAGRWPLIGGVGVRIGAGQEVGVISSTGPVVRIRLRAPIRVPIAFGLSKSASTVLVSVAAPGELIAALESRTRAATA